MNEQQETTPQARETFYCTMCGGTPLPTRLTCETCSPAYFALHDFVRQWMPHLSEPVLQAILAAPYQFGPTTGKPVDEGLTVTPEQIVAEGNEMRNTPVIVCLCGSTRFHEAFHEVNLKETLAGKIVLTVGCDFKSDTDLLLAGELTETDKKRLDELHLRKIDIADEVLILNVGGYIGESTANEIAYAREHGKTLRYLE